MKTAGEAINRLDEMRREIDAVRARLANEADQIAEEWNRLCSISGPRDDHAAELLKRLRPHLSQMDDLVAAISDRIEQVIADPFNREGV